MLRSAVMGQVVGVRWLVAMGIGLLFLASCVRAFSPATSDDASSWPGDATPLSADGVVPTADGGDASLGSDLGPPGAVSVSNLGAAWTTPTHILWTFEVAGLAGDLEALVLITAESRQEVLAGVGSTVRVDRYPRSAIGLADDLSLASVDRALTRNHRAETSYFAQITAIDTLGLRSASAVFDARTMPEPQNEIVIFADAETKGYSIPGDFVYSTRAPYQGTHHYEWTVDCPEASCYEILRRQDLQIALDGIDRASFESTAFFEFAVASDSTVQSSSRLRVWFGTAAAHTGMLYEYGYWAFGTDDVYRRYQIPLRALVDGTTPLSYEIATGGIYEFGFDGTWSKGAIVRSDEWRVRW